MPRKNASRPSAAAVAAASPTTRVRLPGVTQLLSIEVTSIARDRVTGEMRIGDLHLNRSGFVNGGALMALADVLGARGTVENLPPGHRTTTIESKTNFFAGGTGPVVEAESIPLHIGRTTMVWQTTIRNRDGRRVAIVTQTQIVIPDAATARSESAPQAAQARTSPRTAAAKTPGKRSTRRASRPR